MKKKFSREWKASKQTRKQRKYRYNAPKKIKQRFLSSNLSKELKKRYNRKSFQIRKGDKVKVMIGEFKDKEGKISYLDLKKMKVGIEGIQITKKDGTKVNVKIDPSNLQIKELNLDDKKRIESLEEKTKQKGKQEEKLEEKPNQKQESKENAHKKKNIA